MKKIAVDLSSVTTVGLDLAKLIFFVHAVDAEGRIVVARSLRRQDVLAFFQLLAPRLRIRQMRDPATSNRPSP